MPISRERVANWTGYIHTTAERLLKEKWGRDEPFEITMKVRTECKKMDNCLFYKDYDRICVSEKMKTFDLKKQYSRCIVEKKYSEFVPDLCLIDDTSLWTKMESVIQLIV